MLLDRVCINANTHMRFTFEAEKQVCSAVPRAAPTSPSLWSSRWWLSPLIFFFSLQDTVRRIKGIARKDEDCATGAIRYLMQRMAAKSAEVRPGMPLVS